jgi:Ca2+-binding RTX toxin-like protein
VSPTPPTSYGGDSAHAASTDSRMITVVAGHPTSTSVSCSPNILAIEQSTTCTATVTDASSAPTTPTGQVGFYPGGPGSFSGTPCTLSGAGASASCSATFTPSGPEAGGDTMLLATYLGDGVYLDSSATTTVTVEPGSEAACAGRAATIVGRAGADRLRGTRDSDVIVAGPGNHRIGAGGGADLVCAGPGNDRVFGGGGNDIIYGGPGDDVLNGGPGNDIIYGGPGNDTIRGGPGNDIIFGLDGHRDTIDCGPGNDIAIVDRIDRTRNCEIINR